MHRAAAANQLLKKAATANGACADLDDESSKCWPTVTLVHVGKTAGETVLHMLQDTCKRRRNRHCSLLRHNHTNDPWQQQVHNRMINDADLDKTSIFVITMRDPFARTVSAFNWRHPRGGGNHSFSQFPVPWNTHPSVNPLEVSLYECFEQVNDFANALEDQTVRALVSIPRPLG